MELINETIKSTKQNNINILHSFNTIIINSRVEVINKMERGTSGIRLVIAYEVGQVWN